MESTDLLNDFLNEKYSEEDILNWLEVFFTNIYIQIQN